MACKNCNDDGCRWNINHTCRVCELLNGDSTKKKVCHCDACGEYICKDHWDDWISRPLAAVKEFFTVKLPKVFKGEGLTLPEQDKLNKAGKKKKHHAARSSS